MQQLFPQRQGFPQFSRKQSRAEQRNGFIHAVARWGIIAAPFGDADVTLYAKWLSANALLSELSTDQGTLRPEFSPSKTNYSIDLAKTVSSLNIFVRKGDPNQSLTVIGADSSSVTGDVYSYEVSNLTLGPNPIQVTVTAENRDRNTYRLTVNVSEDEPMGQPIALDPSVRTLTFPGGLAIRLPDGLTIPPGATLTVRESSAAPSGEIGLDIAGQVIDFQFEGITIDRPTEITLGYDENADPGKIAIYHYDESTHNWEYQPSRIADNGIQASVSHFSTYGVLSDTTAPARVTVSPGVKTGSSITLHLAANDASGVAAYLIYRDGTLVAETAVSTYVDAGLSASRTYTYAAKAVDMLGNMSNVSESITVTTNGGAAGTGNIGGGSQAPASDAIVFSADGKLTLPANRAGEVRMGEAVAVIIPAGASDQDLTLTIENVSDSHPLPPEGSVLASPVYEIMKNDSDNFKTNVTLILAFDPSKVKANHIPVVFYYDEAKKEWVEIAGGQIEGHRIAVEVNHFTKFAVFGVDREARAALHEEFDFSDIAGHWAEAGINQAVSDGIVSGYPDGTFKPNAPITRAEFTLMLAGALRWNGTGAALRFSDTDEIGDWTRRAVALAVQEGIVSGYEDGSFRPDAKISRAEMAAMIAKALKLPLDAIAQTGFADDEDIPTWAKGAVEAIRKLGIVSGRDGNAFVPNDTGTRSEAVVMLLRMLERSR